VNAYQALVGVPSTAKPDLRLEVLNVSIEDEGGDGGIQNGESAELAIVLQNYHQLAGSNNLTLTLESDDPAIQITDSTMTISIGADTNEEVEETFSFSVASNAPSGLYQLSLTASATDANVSPVSDLDLPPLIVANGGVLVWEGAAGLTFSGRYLADELEARNYEVTYVVGDFPSSLIGFDGVFLSFGNASLDFLDYDYISARLDEVWKAEAIDRYLRQGGRLYLEGSDTLGFDIYYYFTETASEILLPLFGIESAEDGDEEHEFAGLEGFNGSLTEGMQFSETTQDPAGWIDIFTPGGGLAAFTEPDYGVVAVQHAGSYDQRAFSFAYTIADLVDGSTTKAELLDEILEFLSIGSDVRPPLRMREAGPRLSPGPVSAKREKIR
jgi:hypothetical protein